MEILYQSSVTRTTEHREDWAPTELYCPSCGRRPVWHDTREADSHVCLSCGIYFDLCTTTAPGYCAQQDQARLAALRAAVPGKSEAALKPGPPPAGPFNSANADCCSYRCRNKATGHVLGSTALLCRKHLMQVVYGTSQCLADDQFRALMDLMMASDPWPVVDRHGAKDSIAHDALLGLVDTEARARGFDNWIVAYHEFKPAPAAPAPTQTQQEDA